jgi:enolase
MAIKKAGYKESEQIALALDVASSEFYDTTKGIYTFKKSTGKEMSGEELVSFYETLTQKYPIISIEDGCAEGDWKTWEYLTDKIGKRVQLVGDDLFVTNVKFLKRGIDEGVANHLVEGEPGLAQLTRRSMHQHGAGKSTPL